MMPKYLVPHFLIPGLFSTRHVTEVWPDVRSAVGLRTKTHTLIPVLLFVVFQLFHAPANAESWAKLLGNDQMEAINKQMREQAEAERREEKKLDEKLRKMGEVKRTPTPADEINSPRRGYSSDPGTRLMQIQMENSARKSKHNLEIMNRCSASDYKDCDLDRLVK